MSSPNTPHPISASNVGVGLKPAHYRDALSPIGGHIGAGAIVRRPDFFEVHAENYMCDGGAPHQWLTSIREHFPLSIHGVCLSLGGIDNLDKEHLNRLRTVIDRYEPALVSEHIAWCAHDGIFLNDLIALPFTKEALRRTTDHINETQEALARRILIENPSQYLAIAGEVSEPEFLNTLARETGCGLLLDINNVYVSAANLGFDPIAYVDQIDAAAVEEIHLAGHAIDRESGVEIRIDDHGSPVSEEVGGLYKHFIGRAGARPTLVEWDTDTPALDALCREAEKAARWMAEAAPGAAQQLAAAENV